MMGKNIPQIHSDFFISLPVAFLAVVNRRQRRCKSARFLTPGFLSFSCRSSNR